VRVVLIYSRSARASRILIASGPVREQYRGEAKYMRILVVDDSTIIRKALGVFLGRGDTEIVGEAINGKEAIEQFRSLKPDLVTLDITMPEMNGLQALKEIMAIDPGARVIIVSALSAKENAVKALGLGAKAYIMKPFKKDELEETISAVMAEAT
jgi:two-component system chemotaxis response regulator CheY